MLSKWEEEIEGEEAKIQWLPVRLAKKHKEDNGSWDVIRKDGFYASELVEGTGAILNGYSNNQHWK